MRRQPVRRGVTTNLTGCLRSRARAHRACTSRGEHIRSAICRHALDRMCEITNRKRNAPPRIGRGLARHVHTGTFGTCGGSRDDRRGLEEELKFSSARGREELARTRRPLKNPAGHLGPRGFGRLGQWFQQVGTERGHVAHRAWSRSRKFVCSDAVITPQGGVNTGLRTRERERGTHGIGRDRETGHRHLGHEAAEVEFVVPCRTRSVEGAWTVR